MILVLDVATKRVVFFTNDMTAPLVATKNTTVINYRNLWPEEITLKNCWNWVLVDGMLKHAATYNNELGISVLEINRKRFKEELNLWITNERSRYTSLDVINIINTPGSARSKFLDTIAMATGRSIDTLSTEYSNLENDYVRNLEWTEYVKTRFEIAYSLCRSYSELINTRKLLEDVKTNKPPYTPLVKLETTVDIANCLNEISELSDLLWTSDSIDSQQESFVIPVVKAIPIDDIAYPDNMWNSLKIQDTPVVDMIPNIMNCVNSFADSKNAQLARFTITKMSPSETVSWAADVGDYYSDKTRYHLCLSGEYSISVLDANQLIAPGHIVMLDNKMPHMMTNNGSTERVSVVFDLVNPH